MSTENQNLLGQFIPLHYHCHMLMDQVRVGAFKKALERGVPSGAKVLELGGGTGILSFFAAKNASKVYCVEYNPEMVNVAREYLALNNCLNKVELIHADACSYVPPEPVDVVICEMCHAGLLREKQIEAIDCFKRNYAKAFPQKTPLFIPEATILAVQPVEQNYNFGGYYAPLPCFSEPTATQALTRELAAPQVYSMFQYRDPLAHNFGGKLRFSFEQSGSCNALRFVTKNVLLVLLEEKGTIDWHNQYLVLPLKQTIKAEAGKTLDVQFTYQAGASLESVSAALQVTG